MSAIAEGTLVAPGWMLAVTAGGLVAVGPETEIEIELSTPPDRLAATLDAIVSGEAAGAVGAVAALSEGEAAELLSALGAAGVLNASATVPAATGHSLASALAGRRVDGDHEIVYTADEALVLPAGLAGDQRDAALRAFIAGIGPDARLFAYAGLLQGRGRVAGDLPVGTILAERLSRYPVEPESIAVIELGPHPAVWRLPSDQLESLDAGAPHRLGPIARVIPGGSLAAEGMPDLHFHVADVADADLRQPAREIDRRAQGVGTFESSELIARAEGAERFAIARPGCDSIRTASAAQLAGAIAPEELFAFNRRQEREAGIREYGGKRSWCEARTTRGERRWLPAELVFTGNVGAPDGVPLPATSSGVAAHTEPQLARDSALSELIERDAFMWTWIQRLSRELVDPRSVPDDVAAWSKALGDAGWRARWVNLTLETQPVILCCLTHARRGLVLGAASRLDAAGALRRATLEALVLALRFRPDDHAPVDPRQVRGPVDHLMLHMDPRREPDHAFLYSSNELVELADIVPAAAPADALAAIGVEPVYVDLSSRRTRPFTVVRAAAAGLVPLSFGWDREPLGMPLLSVPRSRPDGSGVGAALDLKEAAMPLPHPFP